MNLRKNYTWRTFPRHFLANAAMYMNMEKALADLRPIPFCPSSSKPAAL